MNSTLASSSRDTDGLFARARAGDPAAWDELFKACHPKVVRVVRRRLDRPMRSLYDSTDFASAVWGSLAAKMDQFDFLTVEQLVSFLAKAAEQKIIDEYRRQHTLKRDIDRECRLTAPDGQTHEPRAPDPTPSQVAQASEGLERLLAGQSDEHRRIIELRRLGYSNEEIAEETGWHIRRVQRFLKDLRDSWTSLDGGL